MSDILNPYIAGAPVVETSMFFGRENIFSWIERSLAGKYVDHILVLHGQRRVGKTSVLKQIPNFLPNKYIQVFFDLQGRTGTTLDRFLWWLASEIVRTLKKERGITLPKPDRKAFKDTEYLITEFLPSLQPILGEHVLLLTFDEFDTLDRAEIQEEFAKPLIAYLRRLIEMDGLSFIFSIGSSGDKLENMQASYTDFFKSALYRKISFLTRDDCYRLITKPVEGVIKYDKKAVDQIAKISSGHPYFAQLTCHELFSRCQKTGSREVSAKDVEAILEDVIERGTVNLKFVWDEASNLEKWILAALAQMDGGNNKKLAKVLNAQRVRFSDSDLNSSVIHLQDKDVITQDNRFVIHLMRMWLTANRPLDRVCEELVEVNPIANRYIEIGDEYRDRNQNQVAIESYQQALSADPGNLKAQSSIATIYLKQEDYPEAVTAFELALKIDDEDVVARTGYCNAHLALGDAARAKNDVKEAIICFQSILAVNPDHENALQRLSEIRQIANDYTEAQQSIRKKRYGHAIELLQGIIAQDPTYKSTSRLLVEAVEANKAIHLWQRPWLYLALGGVTIILLGIFFVPRILTSNKNDSTNMPKIETTIPTSISITPTPVLDFDIQSALYLVRYVEPFYQTTFDSWDFEEPEGNTKVEDGKLIVTSEGEHVVRTLQNHSSSRFAVEYELRILESSSEGRCIFYSQNDDEESQREITTGFFSSGDISVNRLLRKGIQENLAASTFDASKANTITLIILGDQISGFINGQLAYTTLDPEGSAIYTSTAFAASHTITCEYDNYKFWDLSTLDLHSQGEVPAPGPRILNPKNQHLYRYYENISKSWHDARDYCAAHGGYLVTIQNAEENEFVFQLTGGSTWLGATDEAREGIWVWVTGDLLEYTNWSSGQPDHDDRDEEGDEDYLSFLLPEDPLQWSDRTNANIQPFVCEWNPEPSPEPEPAFYEPILAYTIEHTPTFVDNFSATNQVWGGTSEGLALSSMVYDGILQITDHGDSPDHAIRGLTFPTNGLFDAANFVLQFDFSFVHTYHPVDEIGVQIRRSQDQNTGYNINFYSSGEWRFTQDDGTTLVSNGQNLPKDGYNTFLLIVQDQHLAIFLNGFPYETNNLRFSGTSNRINVIGEYGSDATFDNVKFWNLDGVEIEEQEEAPGATSFSATALTYITEQTPTFEDDFSTIKSAWGDSSEGIPITALIVNGNLGIIDHINVEYDGDFYPPDYKLSGVSLPSTGLLDASDFALQFNFAFDRPSTISLQFRSAVPHDTGYRISFSRDGSWNLIQPADGNIVSKGYAAFLPNSYCELLLIAKGSNLSIFLNEELIYEGNDLAFSGTSNKIIVFASYRTTGRVATFDNVRFWNLDGVDINQ